MKAAKACKVSLSLNWIQMIRRLANFDILRGLTLVYTTLTVQGYAPTLIACMWSAFGDTSSARVCCSILVYYAASGCDR